jgi:hypothetical protein
MTQHYEITLIGEIKSAETLVELAQHVCPSDLDIDAVRKFQRELEKSGGLLSFDELSDRGNPYLHIKSACLTDDVGWKETVADEYGEEPHTLNTWMKGFGKERSITLGRGGVPTLTLRELEAGLWMGPDTLAAMVRDLRKHSLVDVEPKLSIAPGLADTAVAEVSGQQELEFVLRA